MHNNYIHLFSTTAEFNTAYTGTTYHEPWVSYTVQNEQVDYNKETTVVTEDVTDPGAINF